MDISLSVRMAKASMEAAIIFDSIPRYERCPVFEAACKLRGLETHWFRRWSRRVSDSVYARDGELQRLRAGAIKCFSNRLVDPHCEEVLMKLCEEVETFVSRYVKKS